MIDFHTHILPNIDDGSNSVEESLTMLRKSARQRISLLALTPHFYADVQSPREFLIRRQAAWEKLRIRMEPGMPDILLGAEVKYFEGICTAADIPLLRLEQSELLLLEMPFCRWTERMVNDILELNSRPHITVLLAHIERYLAYQPASVWDRLLEDRVKMQSNASFFINWKTRRKAMRLLQRRRIHVLGSDCHNMSIRPPNLEEAMAIIRAKMGREAVKRLKAQASALLKEEEVDSP